MKSIANNQLTLLAAFSYGNGGANLVTAAELDRLYDYADDKAIHRIFNRHSDEFTTQMTGWSRATTPGGMQRCTGVFPARRSSDRYVCRTAKAKEFRRWVLDVLDSRKYIHISSTGEAPVQMKNYALSAGCGETRFR